MEWFYAKDGKQLGPVAFDELKRMAGSGELRPESLIWKKGMAQWTAANAVEGIFAPGTASTAAGSSLEGAGFWIRFLARIIDMIYIGILGVLAGVAGGIVIVLIATTGHLGADWQDRLRGFSFIGLVSALLGTVLYHGLCEGLNGATVGKRLLGLRVMSDNGAPTDVKAAIIRTLGFYIDGLFFGLVGYYSMRQSGLRQRFGDKWSHTMVARAADLTAQGQQPLGPFFLALAYGSAACAASLALGLLLKVL